MTYKELNQLKIDITKNKDKTVVTKVVQSSQKLRKFSGDTREAKDWVAEAKRSVTLQGLEDRHAVSFVLSHLEGDARNEMKYSLNEDTCGVDDVYEGVLGAFTELVTANEALDDFYSRKQEDGESIRDFSYAMMTFFDRAVTMDSGCVANKDLRNKNAM